MLNLIRNFYSVRKDILEKLERSMPKKYTNEIKGELLEELLINSVVEWQPKIANVLEKASKIGALSKGKDGKYYVGNTFSLISMCEDINTSPRLQILFYMNRTKGINLKTVYKYLDLGRLSSYPLPTAINYSNKGGFYANRNIAVRGLNPYYDIEKTLDKLNMDVEDFNSIVRECYDFTKLASKLSCFIEDSYTLVYLMRHFNITLGSLKNAKFVEFGEFVTIQNYMEMEIL